MSNAAGPDTGLGRIEEPSFTPVGDVGSSRFVFGASDRDRRSDGPRCLVGAEPYEWELGIVGESDGTAVRALPRAMGHSKSAGSRGAIPCFTR